MILCSRINGKPIYINPHLIETIETLDENNPDTRINFFTGKQMIVKESPAEVINRIVEYRRRLGINSQDI